MNYHEHTNTVVYTRGMDDGMLRIDWARVPLAYDVVYYATVVLFDTEYEYCDYYERDTPEAKDAFMEDMDTAVDQWQRDHQLSFSHLLPVPHRSKL